MTAVKFSFARVSLNESPLMRKLHLFQSARCLYNKLDQSLCSVKNKQTKKNTPCSARKKPFNTALHYAE